MSETAMTAVRTLGRKSSFISGPRQHSLLRVGPHPHALDALRETASCTYSLARKSFVHFTLASTSARLRACGVRAGSGGAAGVGLPLSQSARNLANSQAGVFR